jgi:hypothetical protein
MAVPFLTLIAKEAIFQLFNKIVLAQSVNRDYENYVATKGQTVTVILPETPTVQNAGGTFTSNAADPSTVNVTLSQWRETVPIKIDSRTQSMSEIDLALMYAQPVANALALDVETYLAGLMASGFTGTAIGTSGVAPTGVGPLGANIKAAFDAALTIPDDNRVVALGPTAEAAFHSTFGLYTTSGPLNTPDLVTGQLTNLGTRFGMNYLGSPLVQGTHQAGFAFHKTAISLACRPMQESKVAVTGTMVSVDYRGIGITLEHWHDPFSSADYLRAQMLYGASVTAPGRGFLIYD